MSRTVAGLVAVVILFGCGESSETIPASRRLDSAPPLTIGAQFQRPADVILPADYSIDRSYPLVILLHGFGATGALQDFIFHLATHTTRDQFILVLPNGTLNSQKQRFWDATPECCNFEGPPVDDVGYIASLMREAMEIYAVDPHRIRLVGHSNGAYMSYRYVCEHPVAVDRIVVLAGSTVLKPEDCRNPLPVDIVHTHGTLDDTVPYEANLPPDGDPRNLYTVGAAAAVGRWAHVAGCAADPELIGRRDYHKSIAFEGDPAETEVFRYRNCTGGKTLELWKSNAANHLFLSANDLWRDDVVAFVSQ